MNYAEFKDRRSYERFAVPIPLSYDDADFTAATATKTNDISVEGLSLVTDKSLIPGTGLDICLQMIDNGERILLKGRVIWSRIVESGRYRAGVKIELPKLKPIALVLRTIKSRRKY